MSETNGHGSNWHELTPEESPLRGQGLSEPLLLDPHRTKEDLRLANRAVRNRWRLKPEKCDGLVDRLFGITEKTAVSIVDRNGELVEIDSVADENAISAAKVIVSMMGQNQVDERAEDDPKGVRVEVGVNVGMAVQNALTADPSYLEWLRDRELAEGGQPHAVGQNGHGTNGHALLGATPHQGNGSGSNGHHPGNGRH